MIFFHAREQEEKEKKEKKKQKEKEEKKARAAAKREKERHREKDSVANQARAVEKQPVKPEERQGAKHALSKNRSTVFTTSDDRDLTDSSDAESPPLWMKVIMESMTLALEKQPVKPERQGAKHELSKNRSTASDDGCLTDPSDSSDAESPPLWMKVIRGNRRH